MQGRRIVLTIQCRMESHTGAGTGSDAGRAAERPASKPAEAEAQAKGERKWSWQQMQQLGRGAFGTVVLGLTDRGELMAVKQVLSGVAHQE